MPDRLKRDILEIAVPTVILPRIVCEICFERIVQHVVEFLKKLSLIADESVIRFILPDVFRAVP